MGMLEKLFEAGADDVYMQNIVMKKNRPAIKLSALCSHELCNTIGNIILQQTSTLGYRKYKVEKKNARSEMGYHKNPLGSSAH